MLSGDAGFDVIFDAKRFIGRVFEGQDDLDEFVGSADYPFKLIWRNDTRLASFQLTDGRFMSPVEVGSLIVRELANAVEKDLKGSSVSRCVMAVPAEFNEFQRQQTSECAGLVGIDVVRVINEPTAAALAYGLHHRSTDRPINVIVIDVGGGTTDVSLMRVEKSMFLTIAMAGLRRLGGQDFTQTLMNYLTLKVSAVPMHTLQAVSEQCKRDLSVSDVCGINVRLLLAPGSGESTLSWNFTRSEFERINEHLFKRVIEPIDAVLSYAAMQEAEVDEIVLVGGSSRIPRIRQIICDRFNRTELNSHLDPDTTVVYGLAIQAGIVGQMWPIRVSATEVASSVTKLNL